MPRLLQMPMHALPRKLQLTCRSCISLRAACLLSHASLASAREQYDSFCMQCVLEQMDSECHWIKFIILCTLVQLFLQGATYSYQGLL